MTSSNGNALLALCAGNWPVTGEFPSQSQWRGALMFSLICDWINSWVNNSEAGDLKRHGAHCSGSLEPESSCYDRDWIMELPMEADILTFTGIFTPEDASVASCCSGSAGASVVAHGVALPLYRDCFLDLRLFNSPDLRRLVLCYCCQAWTLETVLGGNTALPRWWTARSIDADAKR